MTAQFNPKRRPVYFIATLMLLSVFTLTICRPGLKVPRAAAETAIAPVDLPAMVLTPSDLEHVGMSGYGTSRAGSDSSSWLPISEATGDSVAGADPYTLADHDQLNFDFSKTGWQRQYRWILARPNPLEPGNSDSTVISEVAEFADEEGAESGLTIMMAAGKTVDAGDTQIGDRIEIRRLKSWSDDHRIVIVFREKNLLGIVQVTNFNPLPEPELGSALLLAETLHERVVAKVASPGPSLSDAALHISTLASPKVFEGYRRIAGETFLDWGETPEDLASRAVSLRDAVDVYQFDQVMWPRPEQRESILFTNRLYRFPDAAAAGLLLEEMPERLAEDVANSGGEFNAVLKEDATTFGDESLTFEIQDIRWDTTAYGYRTYIRVGADAARIQLLGFDQPSLEAFEKFVAAQTACLEAGSCAAANQQPILLPELTCPQLSLATLEADWTPAPIAGSILSAGVDPARTGVQPGPRPDGAPRENWNVTVPANFSDGMIVKDGLIAFRVDGGELDLDEDEPILSSYLYVTNEQSETLWCMPTGTVKANPAFGDGLVFTQSQSVVGNTFKSTLVALDAQTGQIQWTAALAQGDEWDTSSIVEVAGTVYATSGLDSVYAFDSSTGAPLWYFSVKSVGLVESAMASLDALAYLDGVLYVSSAHTAYALDAGTGELKWSFAADDDEEVLGAPTVSNGTVFVGGEQAVYAIDGTTGKELWRLDVGSEGGSRLAIDDGVLIVATGSKTDPEASAFVAAVDAKTGEVLWQQDYTGYITTPAIAGDVIYVSAGKATEESWTEAALIAIDAATGEILWGYPMAGVLTSPTVIGGQVFVGGNISLNSWIPSEGTLHVLGGSEAPVAVSPD